MTGWCDDISVYMYVSPNYIGKKKKESDCYKYDFFKSDYVLPEVGTIITVDGDGFSSYHNIDHIKYTNSKFQKNKEIIKQKYPDRREKCLENSFMIDNGRFNYLYDSYPNGKKITDYIGNKPDIGGNMKIKILSYLKLKEGLFALVYVLPYDKENNRYGRK
jgi:hypothetical protein